MEAHFARTGDMSPPVPAGELDGAALEATRDALDGCEPWRPAPTPADRN